MYTDADKQTVWQANYLPFGETQVLVDQIDNPLRFPGQYQDLETGFYYNYFRDYDPSIGRYIQSDPIGLQGGLNTFGYVEGNPLAYVNPLGLLINLPSGGGRSSFGGSGIGGSGGSGSQICLNDGCAEEIAACEILCEASSVDPDRRLVFGGSFSTCMRSCIPTRCGGV